MVIPWLAAGTVLAFAAGSSSVSSVTRVGHDARWVMLVLLLVAAGSRAWHVRRLIPAAAPSVLAAALIGLALVSATWSASPRLSAERAASLGVLFATALLLAAAEQRPERLLTGLVAGAAAVGVAGLVVLAFDHSAAVQAASIESPARYRGFGQDANTAALLFALALPVSLVLAVTCRRVRERVLLGSSAALLAGSIVASGSRGALFAGGIGVLAVALASGRTMRRAALAGAVVVATVAIGLVIQNVPKAAAHAQSPSPTQTAGPAPARGYLNAEAVYPLSADVGAPLPGGGQPAITRGFFGGSGRGAAWTGAFHQILQRPLLGFGFGTEGKVFVDRYYYFVGGSPENSYLGISLQLGFIGLLVLLALIASVVIGVRRALVSRHRAVATACIGVLAAGLLLGVVQSYVYSVGDIGAATFWICAFLLPAVAAEEPRV